MSNAQAIIQSIYTAEECYARFAEQKWLERSRGIIGDGLTRLCERRVCSDRLNTKLVVLILELRQALLW